MTNYTYRIYKRGGMWLVRKRRHTNASTVMGPFLGIGNAWDAVKADCDKRMQARLAGARYDAITAQCERPRRIK